MTDIQGSCLCGRVVFSCDNRFSQFHFCHCQQCQKTSGSAHAANLFTEPSNINWLKGQDQIKRFDVPGRAISSAFCQHCGCAMPYLSGTGKALVVPAGCLDGEPNIAVDDQIFWAERASWYDAALASQCFLGFPRVC
ncbi:MULTISPECIES: GFA family protein [Motilimonas]|uniref:GFA family protein n=1 Tax=Motilimonas cestriensis TaxID=2742685 RepID=A0ABS8WFC3_9GAMM|nr:MULTISPECIES: GFA family protein [Motilimonas]MCE2596421.1 GFA family protein [Motilimonas cestriensis]MDO6526704.1 GFA family protein [Motilimonas sp. 1_MG-2023]